MRHVSDTVDIPTAGTRVQLSNTDDKVLWIRVYNPNAFLIYFGDSAVSATHGRPIEPLDHSEVNYRAIGGSVPFDTLYADADTSGNDAVYEAILE